MKKQFLSDSGLTELIGYIKTYITSKLTWENVTGKPTTFPPENHSHDDRYFTETEINTKLAGKADSSHKHVKAEITDFPTSMPASDVPTWAKQTSKPTYTKSEVGLGSVDNTADKDKEVKYASSAGSAGTASSVDWSGVKNKPSTFTPVSHSHGAGDITSVNASAIVGTIGLDHLPAGALERCKIVADDTARFKLTTSDVQNGDVVKVGTDANAKMYFVVDETKLSSEAGYTVFSAGTAASVPWSGVTGKPSVYPPEGHTHDDRYYTESEVDSKLSGKSNTGHNHDDRYYTESEMDTKLAGKSNTTHAHDLNTMINTLGTADSTPTDADYYVSQYAGGGTTTTTYFRRPLSALWSYIKSKADSVYQAKGSYAALSHNHTISNITNIGSASVNYANSAGSASSATTATNVSATEGTANAARHVWFSDGSVETQRCYTDSLKYNPVSNSMTVNITGSAASATTASSCSGNAATATNASKVNNHTVNSDVPANAKFTDTVYSHPTYTAKSSGLYKVTVDGTGHVSAATAVTKTDITGLGIPGSDTNTWRPLGTTGDTACAGNDSRLSNARPASDVSAWAKASSKPSYTKSEVGLGNVDNTADSAKSVKYATSAGSANAVAWGNVSGKPSTFTPSSHTHQTVEGVYTGDGGQQAPSYITDSTVKFNMMNTPINGDYSYKDFILMDTYGGSDVPFVTGLGLAKIGAARAFIMSGKKGGKSWDYTAELLSTSNYTSYAAPKSHTHTKSQITDFPSSLPASDVYSWAKASSKPSYTKSEVGLGNVDNTADSQKSVKYATSAGSASSASNATTAGTCTGNSATATSVVDYGDTSAKINIGYAGSGITGDAIKYIAGYTTGTGGASANIKDVSKDALKSWLGLGSLAYSSATIPTIPSSLPANGGNATTVNGHTVNADVPSGAKFTDTDTWRGIQDNLTSTSTSDSLSANQGKVLKGLIDGKSNSGHTHGTASSSSAGFMSATDKSNLDTLVNGMNTYFTQDEINTIFV